MGRPKKKLSELAPGSYRPSRHGPKAGPSEDQPAEKLVKPKGLKGRAAAIWDEQIEVLGGMLRRSHAMLLEPLCVVKAEFEKVVKEITGKEPDSKEYRSLMVPLGIWVDKIVSIAGKFAMSPADRAKIKVVEADAGPPKAKVETRQPTRIDRLGKPKP